MDDLENLINIDNTPKTEEIFHHLEYIHNILEKNKIKHWLMYGTLLGCIRNKDIIPYDYDFDFGILIEDYEKILSIQLDNPKYKIELTTGILYSKKTQFKKAETKWRISLKVIYNEIAVGDLYIYTKCKDNYMRRYDPKEKILFWPKSIYPSILTDDLDYGYIRNIKLPIPKYSICLLEYFYGPMWKIPIKASSQNGENHPDYDYYAGYLYSSLDKLLFRIKEEMNTNDNINISFDKPSFNVDDIDFLFPLDQLQWLKDNEFIDFKKYFKLFNKEKKKNKKDKNCEK